MKVCWNLTNICNKDCTYCFRELEEESLCLDKNILIMKKLSNAGVTHIGLSGGETFLYPDLENILKEGCKIGLIFSLTTNGSLLNLTNMDKYLPYLEKITFSLDSPSDFINERIGRGKEYYQSIKKLIEIVHEKYPDLEIVINSVVSKETIDEVDFMFQEISNELVFYGVKKWKISRFIPLRGHALINKNYLEISNEDFNKIKEAYENQNAVFKISIRDKEEYERKFVISPSGNLKKTINEVEKLILPDLVNQNEEIVIRTLGGHHHV